MLFLLLAADLTLGNFFSAGWNEDWQHRHRELARDMALLRVTTNFLEREARVDYVFTEATKNTHFANALVAYAVNRRLMLEVISNYQWVGSPPVHGAGGGALMRVQLVDTDTASYSVQLRGSPANKGIGQTQASLTYGLAGWHALAHATGLYFSATVENLFGPHKAGGRENDVAYALALARSLGDDVHVFLEGAGTTDLDGADPWHTVLSATPGVRWFYVPKQSLTFGVDVPIANAPYDYAARATWILNF